MNTLRWYDYTSNVYALTFDYPYRRIRRRAIDCLALGEGDKVIDVFCGPGTNLPLLSSRIGLSGKVLCVDGSRGMTRQASKAIARLGLGSRVDVLELDLSRPDNVAGLIEATDRHCGSERSPGRYLFTLGLTCIENWRELFGQVMMAAPARSRFSIMDLYSETTTIGARVVDWLGHGDCSRPVWQELQCRSRDFVQEVYRPFALSDVAVVVSAGSKD